MVLSLRTEGLKFRRPTGVATTQLFSRNVDLTKNSKFNSKHNLQNPADTDGGLDVYPLSQRSFQNGGQDLHFSSSGKTTDGNRRVRLASDDVDHKDGFDDCKTTFVRA